MDRRRLNFATAVFLGEMRRQAAAGENKNPVKRMEDYPPEQRAALIKAIEKAIVSAGPKADAAFLEWSVKNQNKSL